jgi:hypothetical protein
VGESWELGYGSEWGGWDGGVLESWCKWVSAVGGFFLHVEELSIWLCRIYIDPVRLE